MKQLTYSVLLLFFVSCSPKYTASFQSDNHPFRNNITNNDTQPIQVGITEEGYQVPVDKFIASIESEPSEFKRESTKYSTNEQKQSNVTSSEFKKENKRSIKATFKQNFKSTQEGNPKKNTHAILGFVFGLLSLIPIYGMLAIIPGIILSIIGLKVKRNLLLY
jgi:thiol:disulfide interchange protein